jgi:hypothetical protein
MLQPDSFTGGATPEEQAVLVKYTGWGGIPQAFDSDGGAFTDRKTGNRHSSFMLYSGGPEDSCYIATRLHIARPIAFSLLNIFLKEIL